MWKNFWRSNILGEVEYNWVKNDFYVFTYSFISKTYMKRGLAIFTAASLMLPALSPIVAHAENGIDLRIDSTKCDERTAELARKLAHRRAEEASRSSKRETKHNEKLLKHREEGGERRMKRDEIRDERLPEALKPELATYRAARDAALEARRTAMDAARASLRQTHEAALKARRDAVDAAFNTWKTRCTGTKEQRRAVNKAFYDVIDVIEMSYQTTMDVARDTRDKAIRAAQDASKAAVEKARAALKAARDAYKAVVRLEQRRRAQKPQNPIRE